MEGFTGLDIQRAVYDIVDFYNSCDNLTLDINHCVREFFDVLNKKWASPNALAITKNLISKINETYAGFITNFKHILSGACEAGRILAASHDADASRFNLGFDVESGYVSNAVTDAKVCEETLNGVTGMDTQGVKIALDLFVKDAKDIVRVMSNLPQGIAFYDPEGNMLTTYNRNITNHCNMFSALFEDIRIQVVNAINTETDNILLAKQQAQDAMSA